MIEIFYENISADEVPPFPEELVEDILTGEGKKLGKISFVVCDENYLLKINQDFLNHDYHTDVITFHSVRGRTISGEVFISFPMIRENSLQNAATVKEEFYRVVAHGVLHLCGYGDKSSEEILLMREKENYYIAKHL